MSDPTRWVDGHADPVIVSLFTAAAEEEPPPALVTRVLAPLGAGVATLAAASGTPLTPAAGAGSGAGTAATGAGTTGVLAASSMPGGVAGAAWLAVVKWVGLASIGTAASVGTVSVLRSKTEPPGEAFVSAQIAHSDRARAVTVPDAPTVSAPQTPSAPVPVLPTVASRSERPPTSTSDEPRVGLGEEAALIDEARRAIASGDGNAALRTLDTYRRRHPQPLLAPEALYLEMRAHELRGNAARARKLAERLLAAYPNGVHAARARALLEAREP